MAIDILSSHGTHLWCIRYKTLIPVVIGFGRQNYSWNEIWYVPELENNNFSFTSFRYCFHHFGRTQKYETKMVSSALLLLFYYKSWLLSLSFFLRQWILRLFCEMSETSDHMWERTLPLFLLHCCLVHFFTPSVNKSLEISRTLHLICWESFAHVVEFISWAYPVPTFLFLNRGLKEKFSFCPHWTVASFIVGHTGFHFYAFELFISEVATYHSSMHLNFTLNYQGQIDFYWQMFPSQYKISESFIDKKNHI